MNNRVLLVGFYNEKALGVRYLANALKGNGYEPTIVFFKRFNSEVPEPATDREIELLRELAEKTDPLFVGLSVMSSLYIEYSDKVNAMLRENFSFPVAWGGVYATLEPKRSAKKCDLVMRGEGEISIVQLADAIKNGTSWKDIDGLAYFDENGEYVQNDVSAVVEDIDRYGYPIIGGDNPRCLFRSQYRS